VAQAKCFRNFVARAVASIRVRCRRNRLNLRWRLMLLLSLATTKKTQTSCSTLSLRPPLSSLPARRSRSVRLSAAVFQWRHQDFHPGGGAGTTNMFTKAGMHHRNVYIKKYDKLAHLIAHKMAWSFQSQASVISIKTVNDIPLPIIGVWEKIIYHARRNCQIFPHAQLHGARAPVPHIW